MTLAAYSGVIAQIAGLLFVVTSMLTMGLSLTIPIIVQPLKNAKLVVLAHAATAPTSPTVTTNHQDASFLGTGNALALKWASHRTRAVSIFRAESSLWIRTWQRGRYKRS